MTLVAHDEPGGIRVLALSRPPANALDVELIERLQRAARDARDDPRVRAVIVRGNDRFFSGGLDLGAMASGEAPRMANFGYADGIFALWTLPKPTIAEVAGHAIAGGAILALACDVRIAAAGPAKIGINETAIGLAFPRGAIEIARCALGSSHFGRIVLEGDLYSVDRAKELGFVHEVVEPASLQDRTLELARRLASYPSTAYAHNKRLVQESFLDRCEREPVSARERLLAIWTSDETRDAFARRLASVTKKT